MRMVAMINAARISIIVAVASAAAGALIALNQVDSPVARIETAVRDAGAMAPVVYVALYAIATTLMVPGTLFALLGGLLFGPLWGVLWNLLAATIGATVSFLIACYAVADWVVI